MKTQKLIYTDYTKDAVLNLFMHSKPTMSNIHAPNNKLHAILKNFMDKYSVLRHNELSNTLLFLGQSKAQINRYYLSVVISASMDDRSLYIYFNDKLMLYVIQKKHGCIVKVTPALYEYTTVIGKHVDRWDGPKEVLHRYYPLTSNQNVPSRLLTHAVSYKKEIVYIKLSGLPELAVIKDADITYELNGFAYKSDDTEVSIKDCDYKEPIAQYAMGLTTDAMYNDMRKKIKYFMDSVTTMIKLSGSDLLRKEDAVKPEHTTEALLNVINMENIPGVISFLINNSNLKRRYKEYLRDYFYYNKGTKQTATKHMCSALLSYNKVLYSVAHKADGIITATETLQEALTPRVNKL